MNDALLWCGLGSPAVQALLDVAAKPLPPPSLQQLGTLAADWAHELADAMADVLVDAPPVVQVQQLQPWWLGLAARSS